MTPTGSPHQPVKIALIERSVDKSEKPPESGKPPESEKQTKKLVLESPQYDMVDGVLHNENPVAPGSWRVVVPKDLRQSLLEEAQWSVCRAFF